MASYAQARVYLDESAKDIVSPSTAAKGQSSDDTGAFNTGIANSLTLSNMSGDLVVNGDALGLAFSIAEHIPATDASSFTSFGNGTYNTHGKSKKYIWNCCYCGDGGMAVLGGDETCPSCGHWKCAGCTVERGKGRN